MKFSYFKERNKRIREQYKNGKTIEEIAEEFKLAPKTIKQKVRDENETQLAKIVEKHKIRLEPKPKPYTPPKKYSKEWTELQWKEGYRREQLGVIL